MLARQSPPLHCSAPRKSNGGPDLLLCVVLTSSHPSHRYSLRRSSIVHRQVSRLPAPYTVDILCSCNYPTLSCAFPLHRRTRSCIHSRRLTLFCLRSLKGEKNKKQKKQNSNAGCKRQVVCNCAVESVSLSLSLTLSLSVKRLDLSSSRPSQGGAATLLNPIPPAV